MSARKAGPAGRKGDTIGTLVCTEFGCSKNVRVLPPLAYDGYDRELARELRILKLQEHVECFHRGRAGLSHLTRSRVVPPSPRHRRLLPTHRRIVARLDALHAVESREGESVDRHVELDERIGAGLRA